MRENLATEGFLGEHTDAVRDAVEALMDRYELPLYNFLLSRTGNREVAQDCLQQTFLLSLEHLRKGRSLNAAWLYKVGRSKAIDELRRRQRMGGDPGVLDEIPSGEESGRSAAVLRVLSRLTPEEGEI